MSSEPRRVAAADLQAFVARAFVATNTGHVIVAINVAMFREINEFKAGVDQLIRDIRNSKRLSGVDAIRLPGAQSHATRGERTRLGVPLPAPLLKSLNEIAAELGVAPLG